MKRNITLSLTAVLVTSLSAMASGGGGGGGGSSSGGGGGGGGSSSGGSNGGSSGGGGTGSSTGSSGSSGFNGGGFNAKSVNVERALLGESVFIGSAEIAPKVVSRSLYLKQGKILVRMKKQVDRARLINGGDSTDTNSIYNKFDPKSLAGRLTTEQMSALRYYVKVKFPR